MDWELERRSEWERGGVNGCGDVKIVQDGSVFRLGLGEYTLEMCQGDLEMLGLKLLPVHQINLDWDQRFGGRRQNQHNLVKSEDRSCRAYSCKKWTMSWRLEAFRIGYTPSYTSLLFTSNDVMRLKSDSLFFFPQAGGPPDNVCWVANDIPVRLIMEAVIWGLFTLIEIVKPSLNVKILPRRFGPTAFKVNIKSQARRSIYIEILRLHIVWPCLVVASSGYGS